MSYAHSLGMRLGLLSLVVACASPPPPPVSSSGTGGLERQMANCPSALSSAVTRVSDIPEGVAVAVTVSDPESYRRLLHLAERHARIGDTEGLPEHSGLHGGPGDIGHCPIIHYGTQVTYSQIPHGVRFYVRALGTLDVVALRGETRLRVANLPRWVVN